MCTKISTAQLRSQNPQKNGHREGTFIHVYRTYTAPNGHTDEAAYQMEDTGLLAQESPSSVALRQEETAGCHTHETAALAA